MNYEIAERLTRFALFDWMSLLRNNTRVFSLLKIKDKNCWENVYYQSVQIKHNRDSSY